MSQKLDTLKDDAPGPCQNVPEIEESPEFQWTNTPPYMFVGYVGAASPALDRFPKQQYELEGKKV
jgi:hypothetical protein